MICHIFYMVNLFTLPPTYFRIPPFLPLKMWRLIAVLPFLPLFGTANTHIHVYTYTRIFTSRYVSLLPIGKKGKKGKEQSTDNVFNFVNGVRQE